MQIMRHSFLEEKKLALNLLRCLFQNREARALGSLASIRLNSDDEITPFFIILAQVVREGILLSLPVLGGVGRSGDHFRSRTFSTIVFFVASPSFMFSAIRKHIITL